MRPLQWPSPPAKGGVSARGGVCPRGRVSARDGGCLPDPLPVDRMTDACENITFPQLLLRTVKICLNAWNFIRKIPSTVWEDFRCLRCWPWTHIQTVRIILRTGDHSFLELFLQARKGVAYSLAHTRPYCGFKTQKKKTIRPMLHKYRVWWKIPSRNMDAKLMKGITFGKQPFLVAHWHKNVKFVSSVCKCWIV